MLDWKVRKKKQVKDKYLYIFELPTGNYYLVEFNKNEDILLARFHFYWSECLHDFNRLRKEIIENEY